MSVMPALLLGGKSRLRPLDTQFASMLAEHADHHPEQVALAAMMLTSALGRGDICVDLAAGDGLPALEGENAPLLDAAVMIEALQHEPRICSGPDNPTTPLVLDGSRLYLQRYFLGESSIVDRLAALVRQRFELTAADHTALKALFPAPVELPDRQRLACETALQNAFSIISGGPGTGKTTTVARLLVAYVEQQRRAGLRPLVRLAAPTGKAAARVNESMQAQLASMTEAGLINDEVAACLPREAQTLHRLLGAGRSGRGFRHHRGNPLALDMLVIDECSMMDLRLCEAVLDALPAHARVVMLGDRDQLASVDAGNVFAELNSLEQVCARLSYSHRFAAVPAIGELAGVINRGDSAAMAELLLKGRDGVSVMRYEGLPDAAQLAALADAYRPRLEQLASGADALTMLREQGCFQLLCALRDGPFGVIGLNKMIERMLAARGLIDAGQVFYPGRPLLITRNDHTQRLYNGDLGMVMMIDGVCRAVFPDGQGGIRAIPVTRLPPHESAWAMTVHKSQGSEFDRVALLLPPPDHGGAASLVRRELVYTGITRARRDIVLVLPAGPLPARWLAPVERRSGLGQRLAQASATT